MSTKSWQAWICAALALTAASANAQSLKSLRAQEAEETALANEAAYTAQVCGSRLSARIDWRSAADWPDSVSLAATCDRALSALEAVCRSGAKPGARSIASFVCAGDGAGPSLSGSTLRYGAAPGADGFSATRSYLESAL